MPATVLEVVTLTEEQTEAAHLRLPQLDTTTPALLRGHEAQIAAVATCVEALEV